MTPWEEVYETLHFISSYRPLAIEKKKKKQVGYRKGTYSYDGSMEYVYVCQLMMFSCRS